MKVSKMIAGVLSFVAFALAAGSASAAGITGTGPLNVEGKCVDMPGWNTADGTIVQIFDCNGGTNQEWQVLSDGTIRPSFNMNKCLDLPAWMTDNGTPIQLFDCNGGTNQQWTLGGDGSIQGFGGKCIDNPGFDTNDGVLFQYFDCNGGPNQHFSLGAPNDPPVVLTWNPRVASVSGNVSLSIFPDGSYDFVGSFHDSGFWDYDLSLVCVAKDSNGLAYSFTDSGSMHGTESIWLGGSRDHRFSTSNTSDTLKGAYWALETEDQTNGDAIQCTVSVSDDLNSLLNQFGAALGVAGVILAIVALPAA